MNSKLLAGMTATMICFSFAGCHKQVAVKTPRAPVVTASNNSATTTQQAPRPAAPVQTARNTPPAMPDDATRARIQDLLNRIQDVYFDYDKNNLRPDAMAALKSDAHTLADIIRQYPNFKLTVEGYCDERGSGEYNLALGDERAKRAEEYLVMLGLPENQLKTVSYGKERPVCTEHDEACWQRNRRAHITQAQSS
jgi:peptidoglycan-associated lipoprotein